MRSILFISSIMMLAVAALAQQGIQFEHGSWQEQLDKAKQENKLVFVDVYTSWCGPCKKMVAEVFPKNEVGEKFNASFVNYKIDAEKGEGIQIAKKFGVNAYPTYLFVNGDGELVYRLGGYMEAPLFLQQAAIAKQEHADPKPLLKWTAEYEAGKRDKDFLLGYLQKRSKLKLPSAELIDELMSMLTPAELQSSEVLKWLTVYDASIEYVPQGPFNRFMEANWIMADSVLKKNRGSSLYLLRTGLRNYFSKNIIANRREDMLPAMQLSVRHLSRLLQEPDSVVQYKRLALDYYAGTSNEGKLKVAAHDYVNNGLLKLNLAGMQAEDAAAYEKFREPFASGRSDSSKVGNWVMQNRLQKSSRMISVAYALRDAAEAIFWHVSDKKVLDEASAWALRADGYFPHFSCKAVEAGLLYKLGKTSQAIAAMQQAAADSFLGEKPELRQLMNDNAAQMKQGEPLRKLWKL